MTTDILIDANNVLRSVWPNVPEEELVASARDWARERGLRAVLVFDGPEREEALDDGTLIVGSGAESADAVIARAAEERRRGGHAFWLVTSDRQLRDKAEPGAERSIGGGSFARELGFR